MYFCDTLSCPWEMRFENRDYSSFHYVRRGHCKVKMGQAVHDVSAGDLLFIGRGDDHMLFNSTSAGESKPVTVLLCGYFRFDTDSLSRLLLTALPKLLILDQDQIESRPWLRSVLEQISSEYRESPPGADLVVDKLTEVLLVELVRCQIDQSPSGSLAAAVFDSRISLVLELMHKAPEQAWSLENLAEKATMSRSAFARHFREVTGQTMFQYLTELRIRKSKALLTGTEYPLEKIAELVGYGSALAFSRVFKQLTGEAPGRFRRQGKGIGEQVRTN